MFKKEKKPTSKRNKKAAQLLVLIGSITLPAFIFTGCRSLTCTLCGSSSTYTPIYSSGSENGVEYKSCIGPGAIVSCGLGTCLWPTEFVSVRFTDGDKTLSGVINYYDTFGCINDENSSMSDGCYYSSLNCGGCSVCTFYDYNEKVYSDATVAREGSGCCMFGCSGSEINSRNYNSNMPRQYPSGCCGVFDDEDVSTDPAVNKE